MCNPLFMQNIIGRVVWKFLGSRYYKANNTVATLLGGTLYETLLRVIALDAVSSGIIWWYLRDSMVGIDHM